MTPLHIQIMLHCYCRVEPYAKNEPEHRYSEAVTQYIRQLVLADMLSPTLEDCYVVTEKGRAYVEALKSVKEPIQKFTWEQP